MPPARLDPKASPSRVRRTQLLRSRNLPREEPSFYYVMRGYWDDWWMRLRNQAGAGQPIDLEALPRRGYVEVILDGYRP